MPSTHPGKRAFSSPWSRRCTVRWAAKPFRPNNGISRSRRNCPTILLKSLTCESGRPGCNGVRHWEGLSHRFLGAAVRRGVRQRRPVETADASPGSQVTPADHRTERLDELSQPNHCCSRVCQHDSPGLFLASGSNHWRRRWHSRAWHAMQAFSLCMTLARPSLWIPSSFMPTLPGKLF